MNDYIPQHSDGAEHEEPLVGDAPPEAAVLLSNSIYDKVVAASLYILPALAAAYFGLAQIWGLPKAEEVLGTTAVLETLIGALVKVSRVTYNNSDARYDGQIVVNPSPSDDGTSSLHVALSPEAIATKKEISVRIKRK